MDWRHGFRDHGNQCQNYDNGLELSILINVEVEVLTNHRSTSVVNRVCD